MAELFFENTKTGKRYTIIGRDQAKGTIRLRNADGFEFEDKFDVELFKKLGYQLKQSQPA